jgi:hypothetical protein
MTPYPRYEAAQGGEALGEGAHDQIDLIGKAEVPRRTPAAAQNAQGVGIVHVEPAPCFLHIATSSGRSTISPPMEKTPSTTTMAP